VFNEFLRHDHVPAANVRTLDRTANGWQRQPNPHIAELRELFTLACRFGLTSAECDEWRSRFDNAVAALEVQVAASDDQFVDNAHGVV